MQSLKKYRIISSRSSLCLPNYLFACIQNEEGYIYVVWGVIKKLIRFLDCSWNHEYFGSLAKLVKPEGLHVTFARDP